MILFIAAHWSERNHKPSKRRKKKSGERQRLRRESGQNHKYIYWRFWISFGKGTSASGQLLEFGFNPAHGQDSIRWHQFFVKKEEVRQILDFWVSAQNSEAARDIFHDWALDYVAGQVSREVRSATKSKILQTRDVHLDRDFVSKITELLSIKHQLQ